MPEDDSGWFSYSPLMIDRLPAHQRELAERAVAEHRAREPLGTAEVIVYGWEPGQCEVRWGGGDCTDEAGQRRLLDTAIAALHEAKAIIEDDDPPQP